MRTEKKKKTIIKGVYSIRNIQTRKIFICHSEDIREHMVRTRASLSSNTYSNKALQFDWNKYGEEGFKFRILQAVEDGRSLRKLKEEWLAKYTDVYNEDIMVAGANVNEVKCYLLNLEGDILETHASLQKLARAHNWCQISSGRYNTESRIDRDYRVVTVDFYNKNKKTIRNWRSDYRTPAQLRKERTDGKYVELIGEKVLRFKNMAKAAEFLGLSTEGVRIMFSTLEYKQNGVYIHSSSGYKIKRYGYNE